MIRGIIHLGGKRAMDAAQKLSPVSSALIGRAARRRRQRVLTFLEQGDGIGD